MFKKIVENFKEYGKKVAVGITAVGVLFGGMVVLNADANVSIRMCSKSVTDANGRIGTMVCDLQRNMQQARANTTVHVPGGGQTRTHVFFMQQPNGSPVTNSLANVDSGWQNSTYVTRVANGGAIGTSQQIQARHWYRANANHSAHIRNTVIQRP